jgi:hypothetical protein
MVTKNTRRSGRLNDLAATTVRLAEQAGFGYLQHLIALHASVRDGRLVARPSFWQLTQTRRARARRAVPPGRPRGRAGVHQAQETCGFERTQVMSQATRWASVADRARLDPTQAGLAAMGHSHVGFQLLSVLFAAANGFVARHHRHAGRVQGGKFALGATSDSQLVGVVIVGRPVARGLDDTATLEVRRLCTTGAPNACSLLLGAARRATGAHGYRRLVTYTLATESCSSLRAAGWRPTGKVAPGSWSCPSRPRRDSHPLVARCRWEVPA